MYGNHTDYLINNYRGDSMKNKTILDCDFRDFMKIALELKDEDFTKIYFILKGMSLSQENQQYTTTSKE